MRRTLTAWRDTGAVAMGGLLVQRSPCRHQSVGLRRRTEMPRCSRSICTTK